MRLGVYQRKHIGTLRVVTEDKVGILFNFNLSRYRSGDLHPHLADQENIMATKHDFLGSLELLDWRE